MPYPYDANGGNGYEITRTGYLYKNDYDLMGLQTKPDPIQGIGPSNCSPIALGGNKLCYSTNVEDSEYHDSTESQYPPTKPYQRGAIDFSLPNKSAVTSSTYGEVTIANNCGQGSGPGVVHVRIPNDTATEDDDRYIEYRHLDSVSVSVGDLVKPGDPIGKSGTCGDVSAHLHMAVFDPAVDVPNSPNVVPEIEIRFLDVHAHSIHSEGLPIPRRTNLTGAFSYVADEFKGGFDSDRPLLPFQFGTHVRFASATEVYAHNFGNTDPDAGIYDVVSSVDTNATPMLVIEVEGITGKIIQAPINWNGSYPYQNNETWWYVCLPDGERYVFGTIL